MEIRKYKILMIAPSFPPFEFSEALVNAKLCLALKDAGHLVHVISRPSEQYYSKEWSGMWESLKPFNFYVPEGTVSPFKRLLELVSAAVYFGTPMEGVRWAKKAVDLGLVLHHKHQYDIVMSRMPANVAHLVGGKLKRLTGLPWIANWNDPTANIRPMMEFDSKFQSWLLNRFVRKVYQEADLNTFPSKQLWEHFNQLIIGDKGEKVRIIPHIGIDLKTKKHAIDPGTMSIVHAGNMLSNVKASKLLHALSKIKYQDGLAFRFHVFGVIDPEMPDLIENSGLADEVICHAPQGYGDMLLSLGKYDYLLILEAPYPKGILLLSKLSDYASVMKPIIAISPKVGVIADYLKKYGGGTVLDNQDENKIYEGLKEVISGVKTLKASDQLRMAFHPATVVKYHEACFEELCK